MAKAKKTAKKKIVKKKTSSAAAKSQEQINTQIAAEVKTRAAKKKGEKKTSPAGGFPKIVTEAKIQTVSYDATSGSNLKFKDLSLTSGQFEKLVAIAQDGHARVRISIEEINPKFDAAAAKGTSGPEPMFTDLSDEKVGKKTNKKTAKNTAKNTDKKTDGKKGKDATDDGSQLPI